ncbi:substrate-binding domain-containing protein [Marinovum sp. 2_MG-2023]|uniref:LacI family DNA-binding transcriptional regulator n=1 Tax=unclassified Marinovum TaxID=2647166 RepID=UPI0026E44157|nr:MULTISPECIES: substrate-binding domain-containing protein [unclassified Marinovum]MDO6728417.1 substrate-binding domain-containing protein [Marinovum sp. 2_MG-2023]MDO6778167.1 substrate-binding domain-containing protein [Marinovum sp. 1_MG-2023]
MTPAPKPWPCCSKAWPARWRVKLTKPGLKLVGKPTVNDIARVAGVSLATVDRVLNERPGVRAITIKKVRAAIAELGYVRDTAAANLARQRVYNILFILPDTSNEFVQALHNQIADQADKLANERTRLSTISAKPFDPLDIVAILDGLDPGTIDGVALFSPETPSVRDAVNRARDKGIAVVALVSDLPSSRRDHFVGIDNISAGRTAAQLLGRFLRRPGKVLVITGSRLARDHLERRQGFDMVAAAQFPELQVLASVEGRDDPDLIYKLLPEVFNAYPDLRGIYSSAAGNAGLIQFLSETAAPKDLVVIAHELTPLTRQALNQGTFDALISQDCGHLVRSCVRVLRAKVDNVPHNPAQERIRIDIYMKENMPPEPNAT